MPNRGLQVSKLAGETFADVKTGKSADGACQVTLATALCPVFLGSLLINQRQPPSATVVVWPGQPTCLLFRFFYCRHLFPLGLSFLSFRHLTSPNLSPSLPP